jgi:hypothetical protein
MVEILEVLGWKWKFSFSSNKRYQEVEGVGYNVKGHGKAHKGHCEHWGQKYFILYIF